MKTIGSSAGYAIAGDDERLIFANRRARGPLIAGLIFAVASLAALVDAVIWGPETPMVAAILAPATVVLGVAAFVLLRAWRLRSRAPLIELVGLVADASRAELLRGDDVLASLTDVRVDLRDNPRSRARNEVWWVFLRHPNGRESVYCAEPAEAERVAEHLRQWLDRALQR